MEKKLVFFLLGILAAVVLVNSALSVYSLATLDSRIYATIEEARPAKVELTLLLPKAACPECAPLDGFISALESDRALLNVTSKSTVYLGSSESAGLPSVSKLPAIVASGELTKSDKVSAAFTSIGFSKVGSLMVLENPIAPYFDVQSGKVAGLVSAKAVLAPKSCASCISGETVLADIEGAGMYLSSKATVSYESAEGKELIAKNSIKRLPAVVLSGEARYYSKSALSSVLSKENSEGNYVVEASTPVYFDLTQNRKRGEVSIVFLNQSSCSGCADVTYNTAILAGYGVSPSSTSYLDSSSAEGLALIAKYNVTKVPTFLLQGDGALYTNLISVWPSVGTFESDGTMVFRSPEIMGTYVDLATGKTIAPEA